MKQNNNSNSEKSSSNLNCAVKVIVSIILTIAIAMGIGWAFQTAFKSLKPAEKSSDYTVKVNESTGAEEYYDKKGNLEYQVNKEYSDGEKTKIAREVYSDADNKTTKIVYYQDDAKTIDRVDEYKDGNIAVQHRYENGVDTGEYWTFEYNEDGRQTGSVNYDADGNTVMKKKQTYNENNQPVLYQETDADGNIISKTEYNYDKDGKETKTVFYNAEGMIGYVEYKYDSEGRKIRMDQYKGDKLLDYRTFKYDKDGVCTETIHSPDEEKTTKKAK